MRIKQIVVGAIAATMAAGTLAAGAVAANPSTVIHDLVNQAAPAGDSVTTAKAGSGVIHDL